jgi:hypothetical protein
MRKTQHGHSSRAGVPYVVPPRGSNPEPTDKKKVQELVGVTPVGRATVAALHLADDPDALEVRSYWIQAGWHPPED